MHNWPATEQQWLAVQAVYSSWWEAMEQVGEWMRQGGCTGRCFDAFGDYPDA